MQALDLSSMPEVTKRLENLLQAFPEMRREFYEQAAAIMQEEVQEQVSQSVNDEKGKVKNWQEKSVGSGGGYARTKAAKTPSGSNGAGAITNYLNSGHKIRGLSKSRQKGTKYRPRIRMPYVEGKRFYQRAAVSSEARLIHLMDDFVNELAKEAFG